MLKCASAYTYEVDNPEIAFNEIKSQLDEKITLLEHSVGVIMCHAEYIGTGVLKHICESFPFDFAGITTASQSVNGEAGELMLTIFVMTSDDVQFKAGVTDSVAEEIDGPTKAAYDKIASEISGQPKLALIFPPFLFGPSGDAYVRAWGKIVPNMPTFGTLAIDDTTTFEDGETIFNGTSYKTCMSFVLCYGNVNPRFLISSLPENNAIPCKSEVTKATGAYIYEINHMNAYQYFESLDFIGDMNTFNNLKLVPFLIDFLKREDYDGIPVIRGHSSFTEDGTAIFTGDVDEGSIFTLLSFDADTVLSTTLEKIEQINSLPHVNGVLLFPCIVRRMVLLGTNPLIELELARDNLKFPFMMGYAGGEICPTSIQNCVPTNRFHNYSLVALVV